MSREKKNNETTATLEGMAKGKVDNGTGYRKRWSNKITTGNKTSNIHNPIFFLVFKTHTHKSVPLVFS